MAAAGNKDYGYWAGGNTGSDVSTVDRLDFGNDTATAVAKGFLSSAKRWPMAAGNANFGYIAGVKLLLQQYRSNYLC